MRYRSFGAFSLSLTLLFYSSLALAQTVTSTVADGATFGEGISMLLAGQIGVGVGTLLLALVAFMRRQKIDTFFDPDVRVYYTAIVGGLTALGAGLVGSNGNFLTALALAAPVILGSLAAIFFPARSSSD